MGSLEYLKNEILKPIYCMCNECKKLNHKDGICSKCKTMPPKEILGANPFFKEDNKKYCSDFEFDEKYSCRQYYNK